MLKVFNPQGSDDVESRKPFFGNSTGIINLNKVRYPWAIELWRQMRENFWIAEKIDLTRDVTDYKNLTEEERRGFDGILAYLIFLDSLQVQNIPHIVRACSSPELSLCFSEQNSQEALHGQSYQYMIESIIPKEKRDTLYTYWKDDKILFNRCKLIGTYFQNYIDKPTQKNHLIALIADYILEGVYFYTGFCFFYNLASRALMTGSANVFQMINRDELSHVRFYQKLIQLLITEENKVEIELITKEMMSQAVEQEITWSHHIIGDKILGMPPQGITSYIKYLANIRMKALGFDTMYENVKNPFKHLEKIADTKGEAETKPNFFEVTVTSYQMASAVGGWDFE